MKALTRWMVLPALLLSTLAGCDLGDDDSFQLDKLSEARTRWSGKNVSSYSYVLELQCFCAPANQLAPVQVTVVNGAVASVVYDSNGAPAPAEIYGAYDTVNELFELVEEAIDQDADLLQVGYDQEFGFPNVINVDYQQGGSEQKLIFVSEFTVTPVS